MAEYVRVPLEELSRPKTGLFMVYVDYWWAVTLEGELLFYRTARSRSKYTSPQCNASKVVAEKVAEKANYPSEVDIIHYPAIFVPINPHDYV